MELKKPIVLVFCGDGINAQEELGHAFIKNGFEVIFKNIKDITDRPEMIHQFDLLAFPGGFSFGDEIKSGKILGLIIQNHLKLELQKFVGEKKLIIGICNGFQILMELNAFDNFAEKTNLTLTENNHGRFQNFWTKVEVLENESPWLRDMKGNFYLPVRHKEGRIMGNISKIKPAIKYLEDINGSIDNLAAITSIDGLVFGLMPHPEAAMYDCLNPSFVENGNDVFTNKIFQNAYLYCSKKLSSNFKE